MQDSLVYAERKFQIRQYTIRCFTSEPFYSTRNWKRFIFCQKANQLCETPCKLEPTFCILRANGGSDMKRRMTTCSTSIHSTNIVLLETGLYKPSRNVASIYGKINSMFHIILLSSLILRSTFHHIRHFIIRRFVVLRFIIRCFVLRCLVSDPIKQWLVVKQCSNNV